MIAPARRLGTQPARQAVFSAESKGLRLIRRALPALALGSVLAASRFINPDALPGVCVFRLLTGIPCMFCGLTHAFHALSMGHFAEAMDYHPLVFPAYGLVVFHFIMACLRALGWKHARLLPALSSSRMLYGTFAFFSLIWILRLVNLLA
jgi:hypothetical protein